MYTTPGELRSPALAGDSCLICGSARLIPHFRRASRAAVGKPEHARQEPYRITRSQRRLVGNVVRCRECGMVMLPQALSTPADYGNGADPYYVRQGPQRIANAHRLLDLVPAGGRLLDVGCACGFLLVAARARGFAVEGVEVSAWASGHARREHGLDVKTGTVETLGLPAETYDVVVMSDTIEHLTSPRQTVQTVRRILRQGGRLLVLTPDIGSLAARLAGARWWGLLDDHYFYFSRATLRRFLEGEGFTIERLVALGRQFPVPHWVSKLSQYSGAPHQAVERLTRVLHLDQVQISINLGDQMACVARKM
jgi:2-polyprenyl-3-methyl-5-hydroxy-6-metoxy-1,4-benzoquinol methylase